MACIIARIAAKPAMCGWLKMTTDPARTEITIHDDPRLVAGVAAIVSHSAERAGLSAKAQEGLAAAAVQACRETFPLLARNGSQVAALKVVVADFPDRVEVIIEHSGEPLPAAGLDTFCGAGADLSPEAISKALQKTNVDRVQYETKEGRSRTTLIKYCDGHRAKA